ncbi:MAG TPA: hypothetical protein VIM53_01035 [Candidatus Saccharimonadales bacterium]
MSVDHHERTSEGFADGAQPAGESKVRNRKRTAVIAGAAAAVVVAGVGVPVAVSAMSSSPNTGQNLVLSGDACAALQTLNGKTITADGGTATIKVPGCVPGTGAVSLKGNIGVTEPGHYYGYMIDVFNDQASAVTPTDSASDAGYPESFGSDTLSSQKERYGSVVPITLNTTEGAAIPAYYEGNPFDFNATAYGEAVLTKLGPNDLKVEKIYSIPATPPSEATTVAVATLVAEKLFTPQTAQ